MDVLVVNQGYNGYIENNPNYAKLEPYDIVNDDSHHVIVGTLLYSI